MIFENRARCLLGATALGGLLLAVQPAHAADGTLAVTAVVNATCTVGAGATLDFDVYDPEDGALDADTTIEITCTAATSVEIALDGGTNFNTSRRMHHSTLPNTFLPYRLFKDSARSQVWGDTTTVGTPQTVSVTAAATAQDVPVFGHIDSGINVPAGTYNDTVQITLSVV